MAVTAKPVDEKPRRVPPGYSWAMAHTYTVHGHIKRRDGRQEAFWTRTGLSKSAAQKLAKEQRSESGGVAKIVLEEGAAYGPTSTRHHATRKKSPAQLDREITAALVPMKPAAMKLKYAQERANATKSAYAISNMGHVMLADAHNKRLMRDELGGIALIVKPGSTTKAAPSIQQALSRSPQRSHATIRTATTATEAKSHAEQLDREIAPQLGKTRAQIVRAINSLVRAADGRNVYLVRERLGENTVRRVTRARTKGRGMEVYLLDSGRWLGVMPELGDRIDVR